VFRTVRHWWSEGSGQHTARLFVFELTVVIAGVLIAQWLAEAAQQRSEIAAMEGAKARLDRSIAQTIVSMQAWQVAIPCLNAQLDMAMRAASGDEALDVAMLKRPGFRTSQLAPFPQASEAPFIDRYGWEKQRLYATLIARSEAISDLSTAASKRWMSLSLIDPAGGCVLEGDRVNARAAASDIKSDLASIDISGRAFVEEAGRLGIAPRADKDRRLPRDCADIRAAGTMMPYTDGRRH